jgi:hypothetical protein
VNVQRPTFSAGQGRGNDRSPDEGRRSAGKAPKGDDDGAAESRDTGVVTPLWVDDEPLDDDGSAGMRGPLRRFGRRTARPA